MSASDSPSLRDIMAAITDLRSQVTDLRSQVTDLRSHVDTTVGRLRVDLMGRIDRLQHRMDIMDDHLTMGLGYSDRVEQRATLISEDNRLLGEQMRLMQRMMQRMTARMNDLEGKPPADDRTP